MRTTWIIRCSLAGLLFLAAPWTGPLRAASVAELKDETGKTIIRYVVDAPDNVAPAGTTDPAKQVGLFLCFHEHDRPTGDEILPVRAALTRMGVRENYVLLAGDPQGRKYGAMDDEPIFKMIEWAKKTYPINPRRIYMYGKGEGGKISTELTMLHPDVSTAAISHSWGFWRMPSELTKNIDFANSGPELYVILGLRDLSFHITTVRDASLRVSTKGYHMIYREFPDMGARTYYPPANDDAIGWATRLRNKNIPPSAEEMKLLKRYSGSKMPAADPEGYYTGLALVGGAPAGEVIQKLLASSDANVRAAAAETCVHAIFNEPTMEALAKTVNDPSPRVRLATMRALAANANWRSETAQRTLIEVATNPATPDQTTRVAATDGIVQAVRLQIKGYRQDPALFGALIKLLSDQDEELRTMANNILAPIRDKDYRGNLERKELKAPEGGWEQWLQEVKARAEGYSHDYQVCEAGGSGREEPLELYCKGVSSLRANHPDAAFEFTKQSAEKGYVPAQAALGWMYADGKGVQQDYEEATKWWTKAAEGGHVLASENLSLVYRGGSPVKSDAALSAKWEKFWFEHTPALP
jgi:TPR repeat protein